MRVRRVVLNSALGLALVGVGFVAVTSVGSARSATPVGATAPVTRGPLAAVVTASGNVAADTRTQVSLEGSGGEVTRVYVKAGQRVKKGQRLVKIDDQSARQSLETAEASLASAKAALETATQGRSAQESNQDRASVNTAEQAVDNAAENLEAAHASRSLDNKQQNAVVDEAEDGVGDAKSQRSSDQHDLAEAEDQLATAQAAADTAAVTTAQSAVASLTSAVASDESAVKSAESALSTAQRTRASTDLKDDQAVETSEGNLATAKRQLASQRAAAAVSAQPARDGAVKSAQAQVKTAQISVDQAEVTLANTVLNAPVAGTVAVVNAVRGQSSSTSGDGAGAGSSSSSTGSTGSTSSTGSASSSSTTSASASTSGLVVLTDLTHLAVQATVAEADVTSLQVGQAAQVTFSASDQTATGTVTAIDTEETVSDNVIEYGVTVRLDSGAEKIRIGQTASLAVTTAEVADALIVPTGALHRDGRQLTVTRRQGTVDSQEPVQTGLVGTAGTEVTSGLAVGDLVVLPTSAG